MIVSIRDKKALDVTKILESPLYDYILKVFQDRWMVEYNFIQKLTEKPLPQDQLNKLNFHIARKNLLKELELSFKDFLLEFIQREDISPYSLGVQNVSEVQNGELNGPTSQ